MFCDFLEQLKKLKKSSIESVVDCNSLEVDDSLKIYLHIERDVEIDLRHIIKKTNTYNKNNSLILLCGSAGDGKSHLLSILNKLNSENLLNGYTLRNDATESFEPNKSAVETLNDVLYDFSDSILNTNNKYKNNLIIAINLGTLNNFLESKFAINYTLLKDFVNNRNILNGKIGASNYIEDSIFQSINFGDFKNYTLSEDGIQVDFIVSLIDKITAPNKNNIFYIEYLKANKCSRNKKCPIRHNYELLQNKQVQKNIALTLVEMSIKDKYFLSTREILDYIYNIIVHHDFEEGKLFEIIDDNLFLSTYIEYTLPTLMFEQLEISPIFELISKYDHLKNRHDYLDNEIIAFNSSANIGKLCIPVLDNTSYKNVLSEERLKTFDKFSNTLNNFNNDIKTKIFKFVSRINNLSNNSNTKSKPYIEFLEFLYYFNSGNIEKLKKLYDMVYYAILRWNGSLDDNLVNINIRTNSSINLYAKIDLESVPVMPAIPTTHDVIENNNDNLGQIQKPLYLLHQEDFLNIESFLELDNSRGLLDFSDFSESETPENLINLELEDSLGFTDFNNIIENIKDIKDIKDIKENEYNNKNNKNLKKFENNITVKFKKKIYYNLEYSENIKELDKLERTIRIDYSLYKIIYEINNGYIPNAQDKQTHIEFVSFIDSLYALSDANEQVHIMDILDSNNKKGIFQKTPFGYEFKVV